MKCEECGKSVLSAHQCRYCRRHFCENHREALAHDCPCASSSEARELARINCLGDVEFARNYQGLSIIFLVMGVVGILLFLTWMELPEEYFWFWGVTIPMVVGGLIGLCFYTYRVSFCTAELKRMVIECPKCGKQLRGDDLLCAFCGYRLPGPPPIGTGGGAGAPDYWPI